MQYESYVLRNAGSRQVFAVYDNFASEPVCKRDQSPYTTTDRQKADRLASRLNSAREAHDVAVALIDFGATQGDAWRYAQVLKGAV